ncbi:Hypothetical protein POVN_LOCUS568 [uncultured virus]|nr:Hypothetical protein POVN_LOCUS568 [uncultured virus]
MTDDWTTVDTKTKHTAKRTLQKKRAALRKEFEEKEWQKFIDAKASAAEAKYREKQPKQAIESQEDFEARVEYAVQKALHKWERSGDMGRAQDAEFEKYVKPRDSSATAGSWRAPSGTPLERSDVKGAATMIQVRAAAEMLPLPVEDDAEGWTQAKSAKPRAKGVKAKVIAPIIAQSTNAFEALELPDESPPTPVLEAPSTPKRVKVPESEAPPAPKKAPRPGKAPAAPLALATNSFGALELSEEDGDFDP